jgi:acetoin utilization deacetylase AcuC-like enzyme/GNAT superfamily N-acetyltransferase
VFRIRRIFDDIFSRDQDAITQVKTILREQFSLIPQEEIEELNEKLRNPVAYQWRHIIHVAQDRYHHVKGFSIMAHAPDLRFCFLDYIATAKGMSGAGIGGALYEEIRDETLRLGAIGLFFECLPDEPALCPKPELLKQNAARLRFYERYGARPIINTKYETPLKPGSACAPHLVLDPLDREDTPSRDDARRIVWAILERKYGKRCPPGYMDMVVGSYEDDPVQLRPPKYLRKMERMELGQEEEKPFALIVTDEHEIHHVRSRGYVESPVRIKTILQEIQLTRLFTRLKPEHHGLRAITAIHDSGFIAYFGKACAQLEPGGSIYPYVFPIRNASRPPKELPIRAGYYCIDTFTPLNQNAYRAARRAVDCALTGATAVLEGGYDLAYALVRPPGHHAERKAFGGFCYFNSAAAAADHLSHYGRVAVLDIDYHHGNGTQNIFYDRSDVLTISIHCHPKWAYPYFSGFADERGTGPGEGFNLNLALPESPVDGVRYKEALEFALKRLARFKPKFVVLALGFDTAKGDPTGSWLLKSRDFFENGRMIGRLRLPTLIVQEGGYKTQSLGINARHFFAGAWEGYREARSLPRADVERRIG